MKQMRNAWVVSLVLVLVLCFLHQPQQASAQWPPFDFGLSKSYTDGRITYGVDFRSLVDWAFLDLTIKIPLPEGTRYVEGASLHPGVQVSLDGSEVTVFAPIVHGRMRDVYFVVEVTDAARTVFVTQAWIKWSGDVPGEYTMPEASYDLAQPHLDWQWPDEFLSLEASALADGDTITYSLCPKNVGWLRMWDLVIDVQLPPGTTLLASQTSPAFTAEVQPGQVSFTTLELPQGVDVEPLRVVVSTQGASDPWLSARVLTRWKNEGWGVGTTYPATGQMEIGDLTVEPGMSELVVSDVLGDVPLAHTDLTDVSFVPEGGAVKVVLSTVDDAVQEGDPTDYYVIIDADCSPATGKPIGDAFGGDFWVGAESVSDESFFRAWDTQANDWRLVARGTSHKPSTGNTIEVWIPADALPADSPLCWLAGAESWNERNYDSYPPGDEIMSTHDTRLDLTRWANELAAPAPTATPVASAPTATLSAPVATTPSAAQTPEATSDVTRARLDWEAPVIYVSLEASALVDADTVTYSVYPKNIGPLSVRDLRIDVPLPPGVARSSTNVPPSFTSASLGTDFSFTTLELPQAAEMEPLRIVVSTRGLSDSQLSTRVSARWKNEGEDVGVSYPATGQAVTGDLVVQPGVAQLAVTDTPNDVPLADTDLTGIVFTPEGYTLKVAFTTAGEVLAEDPVEFVLYLDAGCNPGSGQPIADGFGADYRIGAEPTRHDSYFEAWDDQTGRWHAFGQVRAGEAPHESGVVVWVRRDALPADTPLCWIAQASSWNLRQYDPYPPSDEIASNGDTQLELARWAGGQQASQGEQGTP